MVLALAAPSSANADEYAAVRTRFRVAYAAAQAGSPAPTATDDDALRAYPLYPYLQVARLAKNLGADAAIAGYLDEHGAAPYTRSLRGAWLADLGARRIEDLRRLRVIAAFLPAARRFRVAVAF